MHRALVHSDLTKVVDTPPQPRLARLAEKVAGLRGWRRAAAGIGLGVAAAAAMPPVYALPLLLVAFPGLVWLADGARGWRGAFGAGWWFGFGFFAAGLYWICNALLVAPERYGWLVPFALVALGAGGGVFTGLVTLIVRLARARGVGRVLMLAAAWTFLEWVRGWIFTGFPWNLMGNGWAFDAAPLQLAAITGVYGLTLITVLAAAMPAVLGDAGRRRWVPVVLALALPVLAWAGGVARLAGASEAMVPGVRLALVQPNIPQSLKWDPNLAGAHLARLTALSREALAKGATHILWPESAVPWSLAQNPALRAALARVVPPGGALVTGAPRVEGTGATFRAWNSLSVIDGNGQIVATYDKFHLVPFGEYMPFRWFLPFEKLAVGPADFSAGPGPRTIEVPGAPPVGPLICYEAIFPAEATDEAHRPGWILNVTNDGWFGASSGPYQHFASARLRAVEEGLPLVRVANTGISGVVDSYGRMRARLGLGREGVVLAKLPSALAPTPYARFGNAIVLLCAAACAAAAGLCRR
jgi:apolipoprotein N-acyltransferase